MRKFARGARLPARAGAGKVLVLTAHDASDGDDRDERVAHLRGALRLTGEGVDSAARLVQAVHRAIVDGPLDRVTRMPVVAAVRVAHDGVRDGVYASVRGINRLVFGALDRALELGGRAVPAPRIPGPLVGALHGVVGDHLADHDSPMRTSMQLRHGGRALAVTRAALAVALPQPQPCAVVFVHGLAADESCWQRGSLRAWGREGLDYGQLLAQRREVTPLYVRYNSGLPIADNGRALATLLAQIVAEYPGELRSLALVGHSMGGLVLRSAWRFGRADEHAWTGRVRDLICLGTPHRGAVLEKVGAATAAALSLFDVTAPIARAIDGRSAGIKDLRHGIGDDNEPTPAGPRVHHLAGTLGRPGTPLAWALGDGLVRVASAVPRRRSGGRTATIAGLNHITMLNHPAVLAWIEAALAEGSQPGSG
ncbi:esterase/lipase family protein [Nannocystis radixulma]|uniref:GPI inositol-deacylase PGAP1-like alpha/beta domain-containing protein n=1 Tax=Nannocystis radixulma TaxID=2995305 RepID=A0ABT5B0Q8_9BACT|nr:hypothetical protein [Nannocystis radixulma]MDC0667684.1 hypothetical protein [Nannocystis radixulma]